MRNCGFMIKNYRTSSVPKVLLPDFIIIGAMKSGTGALFNKFLAKHPCITTSTKKETHFFAENFNKGISWYLSHFPTLEEKNIVNIKNSENLITGEATPYYIFHPHAARRISDTIPKVKLIAILRNPVDRAYSHFHHATRRKVEHITFEEAIKIEPERISNEKEKMKKDENYNSDDFRKYSYLARGIYVDQIKEWMKYFPREQILILRTEDLRSHQDKTLQQAFEFLGVSNYKIPLTPPRLRKRYPEMRSTTRKYLIEYFKPHNERLAKFLNRDFDWDV